MEAKFYSNGKKVKVGDLIKKRHYRTVSENGTTITKVKYIYGVVVKIKCPLEKKHRIIGVFNGTSQFWDDFTTISKLSKLQLSNMICRGELELINR